ncbi:hypothetical protein JR316_0009448 [Psilocybe cubensis]|uniref:Uncharacterized protein n=2 Tax=Psilocybe cubensis TaxID=181762 RepID=A0A8H8CJC1_PSICU|nr:hypothetical protein JR316_0009448 [Psilocybe cubensis]KAH9478985.1 hypothetical protein JR316_0009448 [Psilocybe cubensis]
MSSNQDIINLGAQVSPVSLPNSKKPPFPQLPAFPEKDLYDLDLSLVQRPISGLSPTENKVLSMRANYPSRKTLTSHVASENIRDRGQRVKEEDRAITPVGDRGSAVVDFIKALSTNGENQHSGRYFGQYSSDLRNKQDSLFRLFYLFRPDPRKDDIRQLIGRLTGDETDMLTLSDPQTGLIKLAPFTVPMEIIEQGCKYILTGDQTGLGIVAKVLLGTSNVNNAAHPVGSPSSQTPYIPDPLRTIPSNDLGLPLHNLSISANARRPNDTIPSNDNIGSQRIPGHQYSPDPSLGLQQSPRPTVVPVDDPFHSLRHASLQPDIGSHMSVRSALRGTPSVPETITGPSSRAHAQAETTSPRSQPLGFMTSPVAEVVSNDLVYQGPARHQPESISQVMGQQHYMSSGEPESISQAPAVQRRSMQPVSISQVLSQPYNTLSVEPQSILPAPVVGHQMPLAESVPVVGQLQYMSQSAAVPQSISQAPQSISHAQAPQSILQAPQSISQAPQLISQAPQSISQAPHSISHAQPPQSISQAPASPSTWIHNTGMSSLTSNPQPISASPSVGHNQTSVTPVSHDGPQAPVPSSSTSTANVQSLDPIHPTSVAVLSNAPNQTPMEPSEPVTLLKQEIATFKEAGVTHTFRWFQTLSSTKISQPLLPAQHLPAKLGDVYFHSTTPEQSLLTSQCWFFGNGDKWHDVTEMYGKFITPGISHPTFLGRRLNATASDSTPNWIKEQTWETYKREHAKKEKKKLTG